MQMQSGSARSGAAVSAPRRLQPQPSRQQRCRSAAVLLPTSCAPPTIACTAVAVASCHASCSSSRGGVTGWQSQRHATQPRLVRTRVFDKLRDMFGQQQQGGGWAGSSSSHQSGAGPAGYEDADDDEGAEMVPLDSALTSEQVFGPLAVLLVGFMAHELEAFRGMMLSMEADTVKLVPCTRAMLDGSLLAAMQTEGPAYDQPPLGQRRAIFFSGMYGSEITEVIAAYRDEGLPPCVFAALVPNSAERRVGELLEAVWRDHAAMAAKVQQRREQQSEEDG